MRRAYSRRASATSVRARDRRSERRADPAFAGRPGRKRAAAASHAAAQAASLPACWLVRESPDAPPSRSTVSVDAIPLARKTRTARIEGWLRGTQPESGTTRRPGSLRLQHAVHLGQESPQGQRRKGNHTKQKDRVHGFRIQTGIQTITLQHAHVRQAGGPHLLGCPLGEVGQHIYRHQATSITDHLCRRQREAILCRTPPPGRSDQAGCRRPARS